MTISLDNWQKIMITINFLRVYISILHNFAVEIEVIVISHPEVVRELHVRYSESSKVLTRCVFITNGLNVP